MIRPMPQAAAPPVTGDAQQPASVPRTTSVTRGKTAGKVPPVDVAALVDIRDLTVPGGPVGETWLRIFRPIGASEVLPVVMYVHGDRSAFGNARTRRLASKLAIALPAAVVVVDYSLSPKARYPVAVEEAYTAAAWIAEHGDEHGLDGARIAVAADATGGDLADELMIMADDRGGPTLTAYVLLSSQTTAVLRAAFAA